MFAKKILNNPSFNQITRDTRVITKKTPINNLLIRYDFRHYSSSPPESHFSRGQINNITDIKQPPPGLDAATIKKNTTGSKEQSRNQEIKERDPDDAPTAIDSQAPASSESTEPSEIFDPKQNKFVSADKYNGEHQRNTSENKSDSGKNIEGYVDVITELPSEQDSG
ncbi:hypothetical protein C1645_752255 [Glomus cerebriforme]|uniref:Uncharacterized protein n=1 Tax=Glomus cerebriforme TaxID=658196 RepID=A0A397TGU6_9GLOM|nr:hypothetical protein C1645_752255 [Glomus cerebriforme]